MAKDILRESLIDALSWASLRELPEKDNGENIWIRALALVSKRDGSKAYVALVKGKNGEDRIIRDFGSVSVIVKIEEIYAFEYLDSSYLPTFESKKKEDKIKWLSMQRPEVNYEEMSSKELNKAILHVAMQNQLADIYKR
jgi:hypothetical protein